MQLEVVHAKLARDQLAVELLKLDSSGPFWLRVGSGDLFPLTDDLSSQALVSGLKSCQPVERLAA